MQLQRLAALERDKIEAEYQQLLKDIENYRAILASDKRVDAIIKEELEFFYVTDNLDDAFCWVLGRCDILK